MADLNTRNQQILGLLNLTGSSAFSSIFGGAAVKNTPTEKQTEFKTRSDSVRAAVRKYGIQKTSAAFVNFQAPPSLTSVGPTEVVPKLINLRAEAFNQPGVQFATSEIRRYGVGTTEKKPYAPVFTDTNISFIGDSDGVVHKFFYLWMSSMISFFQQPTADNSESRSFGKRDFEVEYRDNYRTTLSIATFNEIQNKAGVIKLYNAYPIFLGEIQRNWGDTDQLVRFNVSFTFSHWSYEDIDLTLYEPTKKVPAQSTSLYTDIIKNATILQSITSLKRPNNIQDILNVTNTASAILRSMSGRSIDY